MQEIFDIVTENGKTVGTATRAECHGNPTLLHKVAHIIVMNSAGEMLLQKRAPDKDIQPNKWDTSVGGHVSSGEDILTAALREVAEEIGYPAPAEELQFCYKYVMQNDIESELVHTYFLQCDGPFNAQAEEISALRFWSIQEIEENLGTGVFTPNFEEEYSFFKKWYSTNSE